MSGRSYRHEINKLLKRVPKFRNFLVYSYHFVRFLVFGIVRKVKGYKTGFLKPGKLITPKGKNCYFGYYDKTPFSSDGSHYLFHMIENNKKPKIGEKAKICYAKSAEDFEVIGTTLAWNSQQGAMLRFVTDDTIAWNDYNENDKNYVTVFYDIKTKTTSQLAEPLYDISDDGKYGLSIEFERLNVDAEGYGYIQSGKNKFNRDTYIRVLDLETKAKKTIITIESLTKQYPIPAESTFGYFNHLEFNPGGTRFIFIFRFVLDQKRISRLFSSDLDGQDIHLLADDEMVSHCTWKDDSHVTLWCRLDGKNNYYTISDTMEAQYEILGLHTPKEDGHPTYNNDRTKMITDTYPDKSEYRHLIVYDVVNDYSKDIARLYAPILLHGPLRCDFHPRWSPNMKQVAIDSAHEGFRGIYIVDIE